MAKNSMVGASVVLGSTTIKTEWLSSGYPGTADINCIKMAKIVMLLLTAIQGPASTGISEDDLDRLHEAYKINMKEKVFQGFEPETIDIVSEAL